jgi:2-phospho-L-lactate guanylyltransferase
MGAPGATTRVLVPVKAFHHAKQRLAPVLPPASRAQLARLMAEAVLRAAVPHAPAVVCDDQTVADWAHALGAEVVWRPGRGLNGAVEDGVAHLVTSGAERVVVAHADLPLALPPASPAAAATTAGEAGGSFAQVCAFDGITLVPDRHDDGTNVLCLPAEAAAGFSFAYGPGSCARHRVQAERTGLAVRVLADRRLGWDVDRPDDLEQPEVQALVHLAAEGAA